MAEIGGLNLASNQGVEAPVAMPDVAPVAPENAPEAPLTPVAQSATDKLRGERIRLDDHIQRLQDSLSSRNKSPVDQSWLKMAQGFLAPTKTGSFGESAGTAAGAYADEQAKQKTQEQSDLESQFKIAQLQYGMHKENVTDDLKRDFLASWGKPNDIKKVPVTLPDGTEGTKDVPYFNPNIGIKEGVQAGVIPLDKLIELQMKQEKQGAMLTNAEANALGLDTSEGKRWNRTATGTYEIVSGTKPQETPKFKIGDTRYDENNRIKTEKEYQGPEKGWVVIGSTPIDKPHVEIPDEMLLPVATMMANGDIPLPVITGRSTTDTQYRLYNLAKGINPDIKATDFLEKKGTVTAQTAGKRSFMAGPDGAAITASNRSIPHVQLLDSLGKALDNGNIQLKNNIVNKISTAFGGADVTNFNAIKPMIMGEVMKGITGAQGSALERLNADALNADWNSPKQLSGWIKQVQTLQKEQLDASHTKYVNIYNITDPTKDDFGSMLVEPAQILSGFHARVGKPNEIQGSTPAISADDEALINKHLKKKP